MEHLSESNFLLFAMRHYDVPCCLDLEEFNDDIKRFGFINRGLKSREINIQLILNHIIILYNVFGNAATDMILHKVDKEQWKYIVPCLIYLNRLSDKQISECLEKSGILDEETIRTLRNI